MSSTPEGRVKEAVKRLLKRHGIWYYMPVAGPLTAHGIPDFVAIWHGRFLGIETKAPGKRRNTTPNQQRVLQEILTHGGLALVVDDVKQLEEFLNHGT